MPAPTRMLGFLDEPPPPGGPVFGISRSEFFRAEIVKHRECLALQREYYSERAITCVEAALSRLMARLEQLSTTEDGDEVVSRLLRKLDVVTGLSNWTDAKRFH
jgi:hypothetical protein